MQQLASCALINFVFIMYFNVMHVSLDDCNLLSMYFHVDHVYSHSQTQIGALYKRSIIDLNEFRYVMAAMDCVCLG